MIRLAPTLCVGIYYLDAPRPTLHFSFYATLDVILSASRRTQSVPKPVPTQSVGTSAYEGGLKKIEKDLGITRSNEIDGVDGFEAVRLWRKYQRGDKKALKTLISYNNADIINLEPLMERAYEKLKEIALETGKNQV
jgi:hypothetical protein